MCYANPGPRCSAHAAENLKKAKNLLTSAQDKAKQSVAKLSEIPKTDPRRAEAEKKHAENKLAISQIQTLVRVAEIEYDATPKGIEDLKKKLADASPADAQHLQDVLYRAKRTRERMLDLYALQTAGAATDNSNGYHITGNMPNGLADRAARVVGEHNVYVGKKKRSVS